MQKEDGIIVSVCIITYNQEKYIANAIESALMQKVDFTYEIVIGDDCSTDNTREICKRFQSLYPDKIKILPNNKNEGISANFNKTVAACSGKYIAFCEGDDYWTIPDKLQRQVLFLETHEDVSMCFHYVDVDDPNNHQSSVYSHLQNREYSAHEIYEKWTVPTCSVMFRSKFFPKAMPQGLIYADVYMYLTFAMSGKLYCMDFCGGCYRRHSGAVTYDPDVKLKIQSYLQYDSFIKDFPQFKRLTVKNQTDHLSYIATSNYFDGIVKWELKFLIKRPRKLFSYGYMRKVFRDVFRSISKF